MIQRKRIAGPEDDPVTFYRQEYAAEFTTCAEVQRPKLGLTVLEWTEGKDDPEPKPWKLGDGYRYARLPMEPLKLLSRGDREQRIACAAALWGSRMQWPAIAEVVRVPEAEIRKAALKFIENETFKPQGRQ